MIVTHSQTSLYHCNKHKTAIQTGLCCKMSLSGAKMFTADVMDSMTKKYSSNGEKYAEINLLTL